jgi:AcrR family transcriptional regulator
MEIREKIIEEAANMFKVYGIKTVTMDTLANHLGISKRTIYEVFADKDDLVICVLRWMAAKQREMVERILENSGNAIEAIFRLLETSIDYFQNMSPAFHDDLRKFHYEVLMKKTDRCEMPDFRNNMQVIERGINEQLFRKDINPDIINRCLYSLGKSVMDYELYPSEDFTRREVIRNILLNYLRGVSTREGIDMINKMEMKF